VYVAQNAGGVTAGGPRDELPGGSTRADPWWWTGQGIVRAAHVVNKGDVVVHILSGVRIQAD
jgi:hypothetical protein